MSLKRVLIWCNYIRVFCYMMYLEATLTIHSSTLCNMCSIIPESWQHQDMGKISTSLDLCCECWYSWQPTRFPLPSLQMWELCFICMFKAFICKLIIKHLFYCKSCCLYCFSKIIVCLSWVVVLTLKMICPMFYQGSYFNDRIMFKIKESYHYSGFSWVFFHWRIVCFYIFLDTWYGSYQTW